MDYIFKLYYWNRYVYIYFKIFRGTDEEFGGKLAYILDITHLPLYYDWTVFIDYRIA